jgi:cob(I)alamin adenosyltransferase
MSTTPRATDPNRHTPTDRDPTEVPRTHEHPRERVVVPSLVLVNTGDGKGKSTAAFGTMLRALARDWKVAVVQFVKSGNWRVGEQAMGRRLGVDWWTIGDGFTWESDDMDRSEAVALEAWRAARDLIAAGEHHLVVLDEVTYPVNWGWIDGDDVASVIRDRPDHVNVVLTGRDCPAALVELADTVTEMRPVKHAYERGIRARRGIDY